MRWQHIHWIYRGHAVMKGWLFDAINKTTAFRHPPPRDDGIIPKSLEKSLVISQLNGEESKFVQSSNDDAKALSSKLFMDCKEGSLWYEKFSSVSSESTRTLA